MTLRIELEDGWEEHFRSVSNMNGTSVIDWLIRRVVPDKEVSPAFLTIQQQRIVENIVPNVLAMYLRKSQDYGDTAESLGERGQFADMHRKFGKLKRALWDGQVLHGESTRDILFDMIGHCLLTIDFLEQKEVDQ